MSDTQISKELRTERLAIVDSGGNERIVLDAVDGVGNLKFSDRSGNTHLHLASSDESTAIELRSKTGDLRMTMSVNSDSATYIQFFDAHGITRVLLKLFPDGQCAFQMCDESMPRINMGYLAGHTVLSILNKDKSSAFFQSSNG
jgi:hypothetical protein